MTYQFQENQGFIASLLQNNQSFLGSDLLAFAQLDFSEKSTQQAAKRFTRMALKPYLGSQPLKSESFSNLFCRINSKAVKLRKNAQYAILQKNV
ncbi:Recombination protein O [Mannheimia haemolytica]|uniref:Recombination protein O n=1 Tax=Mannheimia haemolytica TaxID=75985 RepID=A0A378NE28_MANHA|nr:Recombination protein O [Mannheimia haemolytica]